MLAAPSCPIPESLLRPAICLGIPEPEAGPSTSSSIPFVQPECSNSFHPIPTDTLTINITQMQDINIETNTTLVIPTSLVENTSDSLLFPSEIQTPLEYKTVSFQNKESISKNNRPQLVTARLFIGTEKCESITVHRSDSLRIRVDTSKAIKSKKTTNSTACASSSADGETNLAFITGSDNSTLTLPLSDQSEYSPSDALDTKLLLSKSDNMKTDISSDHLQFHPNHFSHTNDGYTSPQVDVFFRREWI